MTGAVKSFTKAVDGALGTNFTGAVNWVEDNVLQPLEEVGLALIGVGSQFLTFIWEEVGYPVVRWFFAALGFTGETVYATQSVTVPLLKDPVRDNLTLAVVRAIRNETDLVEEIQATLTTTLVNSINLYLSRGRNDYIYGLPTIVSGFQSVNIPAITEAIESEIGEDVIVDSAFLDLPQAAIWVKYWLQENHNYTEADNYLYNPPDPVPWIYNGFHNDPPSDTFVVDLKRLQQDSGVHSGITSPTLNVPGAGWTVNEWVGELVLNLTDGSSGIVTSNTTDTITASLAGGTSNNWEVTDLYYIDKEIYDVFYEEAPALEFDLYYNVNYRKLTDLLTTRYWLYEKDEGSYPDLDTGAATEAINSTIDHKQSYMLPIIPLREHFKSVNKSKEAKEYKSSKRMLDVLNLDIDYLIDEIEGNEAIDQISNAYVLFAINLKTKSDGGKKALFSIFFDAHKYAIVGQQQFNAHPQAATPLFNSLHIKEQQYNFAFKYDYITLNKKSGKIADVGKCTVEIVILPNTSEERDDDYQIISQARINSHIILQHQVSEGTYLELVVQGPFMMVNIQRENSNEFDHKLIQLSNDEEEMKNFSIPLPGSLFSGFLSHYEQEQLINDSLSMVLYASESQYLEWYETERFLNFVGDVLFIIGVIMLIYDWSGTSTKALWALAYYIMYQYAIYIVMKRLMEIYADNNKAKLAILAAYLVASYYAPGGGSTGMSTAEALLFGVTAALKAITVDIGIQAETLAEEQAAFLIDAEERQEELDKAAALLDNNTGLDLWELVTYWPIDSYEKPDDYFQRTIHTQNPGVLVLDQIDGFHDNLLKLPEVDVYSFQAESVYT